MKALILAAGYATRLYPLTKEYPKPLLEVKSRPLVDYILDKLCSVEAIDEILVVTNNKFFLKFKDWAKGKKIKIKLTIVNDLTKSLEDRLGAIGDMNFVIEKKRPNDDLLVIGGDNLFNEGLEGFIEFAKVKAPSPVIGIYDLKNIKEAHKYGVIKLDKNCKVVDFKEKPKLPKSTLVAMCLYYFPKEKLGLIKKYLKDKKNKQDATGYYIDWLRKKEAIYGFTFHGAWYDIGDAKFYNKAKASFAK